MAGGSAGAPPAIGLNAAGGAISVPGYDGRFTRAQANDAEGVPSQAEWDAAASNRPVPPSAPSEDATTAAYRGLHDNLAAMRDRSLAMARATAGTDASAQYLKLADRYEQEANEISLKAIEFGKPEAPKGPIKVSPGDTLYDPATGRTTTPVPAEPKEPTTQILQLSDGTFQTVNKATGAPIGTPVGHPTQAPRPVTDEERKTYGLPTEGAFTIAPGEAPKSISGSTSPLSIGSPTALIREIAARLRILDLAAPATAQRWLNGRLSLRAQLRMLQEPPARRLGIKLALVARSRQEGHRVPLVPASIPSLRKRSRPYLRPSRLLMLSLAASGCRSMPSSKWARLRPAIRLYLGFRRLTMPWPTPMPKLLIRPAFRPMRAAGRRSQS
jgi:hypothetical protein